jgi:hypothetical protein
VGGLTVLVVSCIEDTTVDKGGAVRLGVGGVKVIDVGTMILNISERNNKFSSTKNSLSNLA